MTQSAIPNQRPAISRADKIRDIGKTLLTFLFCAGFLAYAFMVMFGMPAAVQ